MFKISKLIQSNKSFVSQGAHVAVVGELRSHEYQCEIALVTKTTSIPQRVWLFDAQTRRPRKSIGRSAFEADSARLRIQLYTLEAARIHGEPIGYQESALYFCKLL
jgi:hypothetical protein